MNDQSTTTAQLSPSQPIDEMEILRKVIGKGDLIDLSPEEQLRYYLKICERHKLDPYSKPFDFLETTDKRGVKKVTLYGNKECAAQLRLDRAVSIYQLDEAVENGFYVVTAYARTPDGRCDLDKGVVAMRGLAGEAYANAIKRAVTQAKRRVTLSICGLGMLDETEVDFVPEALRLEAPQIKSIIEYPPTDAVAVRQIEPEKASGLDQWRCGRSLAMRIIDASARLKAEGVSEDTIRRWLPEDVTSRKDLEEQRAIDFLYSLNLRLRLMQVCKELSAAGVRGDEISGRLPEGVLLIRELTIQQVTQVYRDFTRWLAERRSETAESVIDDDFIN